ncbi:MAG: hypothetical protein WCW56_01690 [Candidatus Paceibacterota bacterium]|jgi:hypothetical protein
MTEFFLQSLGGLLMNFMQWSYLWLPILTMFVFWEIYLRYIRANYIYSEERVLLEVKIPKEITKSPKAMELLLEVFYQTYEGTMIDKYVGGSIRGWFSLELVSIGGQIHFYFQIPKFFKNIVEARIYSQYPEVEVSEASYDYVLGVNYGQPGSAWDIKSWEFKLNKADVYPIKTYIDFELEKDPKEEFKIDPMTPLLEFLSSIKPTEQIWIQIMIMASKSDWKKDGLKVVDELMKRNTDTADMSSWIKLSSSPGEKALLDSVERNLSKMGFDVGMRTLYAATEGLKPNVGVGLNSAFRQFGVNKDDRLNSLKPSLMTNFDYFWEDPTEWRTRRLKKKHFQYYCNRTYFYPPASKKPMLLTTEEIATIFHFPGSVATTPTLQRIPSKRGEPPVNLPTI